MRVFLCLKGGFIIEKNVRAVIRDSRLDILKWIALITMVIDHVGFVFFPGVAGYRIIGRIAFPVFAYLIAEGSIRTRNIRKYQERLFLFAFISQIPYMFMFQTIYPNILFTLVIGLLLIRMTWYSVAASILIGVLLPLDYGWWGVLLPSIFVYCRNRKMFGFVLISAVTVLYSITSGWLIQIFAIFGLLLVFGLPKFYKKIPLVNRWIFYWFYPGHLLVIFLLSLMMPQ